MVYKNLRSPRAWHLAPAIYLLDPISRMQSLGHSVDDFLATLNLSHEGLSVPGKYVSDQHYYQVIEHFIEVQGVAEIGFIQRENLHLLNTGVAGVAALTAPTIGASFDVTATYQDLLAVPTFLSKEAHLDSIHFVLGDIPQFPVNPELWLRRWAVETCASAFVGLLHGLPLRPNALRFSYPEPPHRWLYEETFDCDIQFDQARDEIVFSRAVHDTALTTANPHLHAVALRQCEQSIRKNKPGQELVEQLEGIILSSGADVPNLATMAERLNVSARTLQRHLDASGTSFRKIVVETRHGLARELLRSTTIPIKEVAYLVGYTETANFSAAFKKTERQSPRRYRERSHD